VEGIGDELRLGLVVVLALQLEDVEGEENDATDEEEAANCDKDAQDDLASALGRVVLVGQRAGNIRINRAVGRLLHLGEDVCGVNVLRQDRADLATAIRDERFSYWLSDLEGRLGRDVQRLAGFVREDEAGIRMDHDQAVELVGSRGDRAAAAGKSLRARTIELVGRPRVDGLLVVLRDVKGSVSFPLVRVDIATAMEFFFKEKNKIKLSERKEGGKHVQVAIEAASAGGCAVESPDESAQKVDIENGGQGRRVNRGCPAKHAWRELLGIQLFWILEVRQKRERKKKGTKKDTSRTWGQ